MSHDWGAFKDLNLPQKTYFTECECAGGGGNPPAMSKSNLDYPNNIVCQRAFEESKSVKSKVEGVGITKVMPTLSL